MWKRCTDPVSIPVVLYTRRDCPLCEEMKAEMARARTSVPYTLAEVDVDSDADLAQRYGLSVPVLEIAGRPAFKVRLSAEDFARKLARRAGEQEGAG